MEKILMRKYWFRRDIDGDFTDDGNRFYGYCVNDSFVAASKLANDGVAYISACAHYENVPFEIYSKLPHYKALNRLNGTKTVAELTDADLIQFHDDCVAYGKEFLEAYEKLNQK